MPASSRQLHSGYHFPTSWNPLSNFKRLGLRSVVLGSPLRFFSPWTASEKAAEPGRAGAHPISFYLKSGKPRLFKAPAKKRPAIAGLSLDRFLPVWLTVQVSPSARFAYRLLFDAFGFSPQPCRPVRNRLHPLAWSDELARRRRRRTIRFGSCS